MGLRIRLGSLALAALFGGCDALEILDPVADPPAGCGSPTVPVIRWTTEEPGTSQVEYGLDTSYGYATPIQREETRNHEVVLAGLAAGHEWHWRAVSVVDGERLVSEDNVVETCPANEDLPVIDVRAYDPERTEPGFLVSSNLARQSYAMIFNRNGEMVWWRWSGERHIVARARLSRSGREVLYIVANVNHSMDEGEIRRISLDGSSESATRTEMSHHDFIELPSGNYVYLKADVRRAVIRNDPDPVEAWVVGDTLVEIEPGGTVVREIWSVWDEFEPLGRVNPETDRHFYPQGLDWTHCNSLVYSEPDDAIFLSCKHLSTIFKIDFPTGELVWGLGDVGSDFRLTGGEGFAGQHSVARTEGGIMMFNNHADMPDENGDLWSEAVEFEVDEDARTYRRTWSYDAEKRLYTFLMGDSDYMPNGNILTSWGARGLIREIDPSNNEVLWDVATSVGHGLGYTSWEEQLGPRE